jgi:Protein of unknown function (DUF2384)
MNRRLPPEGQGAARPRPAVTARLVTSAPDGLLRLDFSTPPSGTWTLVRAELARRLAEQAVSQAAAVNEADLTAFAVGRGLRFADERPPSAVAEIEPEQVRANLDRAPSLPQIGTRVEILRKPEMLTGDDFARRLGVSRATVALRRVAGRLLALESGSKRGFRYPAWQALFLGEPRQARLVEDILRRFGPRGSWAAYDFFTQPSQARDGRTPLELLVAGDFNAVRHMLDRMAGRADGPESAPADAKE